MDKQKEIRLVHERIDNCTICRAFVHGYAKPTSLDRGEAGRIMIVGQGPGKAELKGTKAFAGQSGKTLTKWLIACGAPTFDPRKGIYFTSIIKCFSPDRTFYGYMAGNCLTFLYQQIAIVRPDLIITLGRDSFLHLNMINHTYENSLCFLYDTREVALITPWGFHVNLMHWPHPSGMNRWHNQQLNREKLDQSFTHVKPFIEAIR
jgi:uracil-DNA glycosylase family 4